MIIHTEVVEDVTQRHAPLQDSSFVVLFLVAHNAECDGECELNEDEREFDPKACTKDAVLAVVDSETLVLSANEDRGDDVTATVQRSADVVNDGKRVLRT